ncbi:MAG: hypothetical protein WAT09_09635 [Paracoccaceae bacterium]
MSDLRALIRELLSEEIVALRAEIMGGPQVQQVRVGCAAELTNFALSVLDRAQDPGFATALREGRLRFSPEGLDHPAPVAVRATPMPAQPTTLVTTVPVAVPELAKALITERDIAGLGEQERRLRVKKNARFTPLAGDEARRRGIRIERTLA